MSPGTFCPRCGGPSQWTRLSVAAAVYGDAVDAPEASVTRTVCAMCAPQWEEWLDDRRQPDAFIDPDLAVRWRDALLRYDSPDGAAANDARHAVATAIVGTRWAATMPAGQVVEVEGHRFDGPNTVWQARVVEHRNPTRVGAVLDLSDERLHATFILLPDAPANA